MKNHFLCLLTLILLWLASRASFAQSDVQSIETDCLILVLDQVELAARRDGIVEQLHARMGDDVQTGQLVLELGLKQAQANLNVAAAKHAQALVKARDRSDIRSAEIDLGRSTEELNLLSEVGRVPYLEQFRARNTRDKDVAELEVAQTTQQEEERASEVAAAELQVAELDVEDRHSLAPVSGTVVRQFKHVGEWCNQGDPVIKILRMDRFMLQAIVNIRDIAPHRAVGAKASIEFDLPDQLPIRIEDQTIEKVSPEVDLDGNYVVWTIIENQRTVATDGSAQWLLRPGIHGKCFLRIPSRGQPIASR